MRFLSTLAASVLGTLIAIVGLFLLGVFFLFALSLSSDPTPTVQPGSVLVVPLEGPIPERTADDPFAEAFFDAPAYDLRDLQTSLRNAAADDRIEAVWLRVRGTTASWGTLHEVRTALQSFKTSGKPVMASSGDFGMGEKAYYVASAADSVFAAPVSPFEWNGFNTTVSFFSGTLEKLDVEPKVVRAGQFKSAVEPFLRDDLSDENRLQLNALLETQNMTFKQAVAESRALTPEGLEQMADQAAILDAESALDAGLLDALTYENNVRDRFRTALGLDDDATVSTIDLGAYRRVPDTDAGVQSTGTGNVAVVYAEGSIVSGKTSDPPGGGGNPSIGSTTLIEALEEARTSTSTKAVVLRINSPGGSAAASEVMWNAVRRTADEKPVLVSMGDVAASGGYYIAAGADSIMATPTTITGSIGVFGLLFNARGLFENKLGITFDQVATSPLSDITSAIEPFTEQERRLLEQSVDRTYDTFLQRVADARGMSTEAVDEIAQGRVWSGVDAQRVGLVDTLGTLSDAIRLAGQRGGLGDGPHRVRILPQPQTFVQRFNEALYGRSMQAWRAWSASPLERQLLQQKETLETLIRTQRSAQARLPFAIDIR
jgi:protease-4